MTAGGLLIFAASLAVAALVPGPATLTVLARVLARGTRGAIAFSAGLVLGDLVWLAIASLGLAAVAEQAAVAMRVLTYAGAGYLLVLAHAFWTAPVAVRADAVSGGRTAGTGWGVALVQGLALQLGNPKVVLFYVALLPMLVPLGELAAADLAVLALVVALVIAAINAVYVGFAAAVRRHVSSPRTLRLLHRASAAAMVLAAAMIAWRA